MMASTVADNVSTQTALLSVNLSRKRRCLRARAPMMASGYNYRRQLDEPIPALGNISPRRAARSAKGREKLVAWLKLLENHVARHDPADPMASYDLSWIWRELDVADLRK